jgi:hypothetical protein
MEPLNEIHETRLRQTLAPTPEAVERVVRQALAGPRREPALRRLLPATSLIAVLLVAAGLLMVPLLDGRLPDRHPLRSVASIETVGEVLLVRPKHGPVSLVSSYPEPSSTGTLIVIHGGGQ